MAPEPTASGHGRPGGRPDDGPALGGAITVADRVAVTVVIVTAVVLRLPMFGGRGLYGDDAWVMLAGKASFGEALRIGASAPGFTLAVGALDHFVHGSLKALQTPTLVLSVAAVVMTYVAARVLGTATGPALLAAGLLASATQPIWMSTRVKPYAFEELASAALIVLAAQVVRRPAARRRWVWLTLACAVSTAVSASLAVVAGGVLAVACVRALVLRDGGAVRNAVVSGAAYTSCVLALYLALLRHLPAALHDYWNVDFISFHHHPGLRPLWDAAMRLLAYAAPGPPEVAFAVLAVALVLVLTRRRHVAAALCVAPLLVAIALAVARVAPIGTGRTDTYLYPPLALLAALGLDALIDLVRASSTRLRSAAASRALGAVGTVVAVAVVATYAVAAGPQRGEYRYLEDPVPTVLRLLAQRWHPGDALLVSPKQRYVYAYYTDTPIRIRFDARATTGFVVVADDPDVWISERDITEAWQPLRDATHVAGHRRVWYLGYKHPSEPYSERCLKELGYHRVRVAGMVGRAYIALWER